MEFSSIRIDKIGEAFEIKRIKGDTRSTKNRSTIGIVFVENGSISYYQGDTKVI